MGSMFAKLQKAKAETEEEFRVIYLREIAVEHPDSYYICVSADDGSTLAMGELEAIKDQLGTDYTTKSVKYSRHDKVTDILKVWV